MEEAPEALKRALDSISAAPNGADSSKSPQSAKRLSLGGGSGSSTINSNGSSSGNVTSTSTTSTVPTAPTMSSSSFSSSSSSPSHPANAPSAAAQLNRQNYRTDEEFDAQEEAAYASKAKAVALKVQRQQEGEEDAFLSEDHRDNTYHTVDDIQALVEQQRQCITYAKFGGGRSSFTTLLVGDPSAPQPLAEAEIATISAWYSERAKYIPLRLEYEERAHLRRVMAMMKACDYTNLVDGVEHKSKQARVHRQGCAIRAVLMGVATSLDYPIAQKCCEAHNFEAYKHAFRKIFEIARRYKVMNPEKMRSVYGKMIYLLQDAMAQAEDLQFEMVRPLNTVYSALERYECLDMLQDELVSTATAEILADGKSRGHIQKEIKLKEQAISALSRKYSRGNRHAGEAIKRCLYSLADNTSYLNSNCKPIDFVINLLRSMFGQLDSSSSKWSLAIYGGADGSRLTHSHERQYHYVLQSLSLWREIVHDMFRLWYLAEKDLLDTQNEPYKLKNTGQGFNRLQQAPLTKQAMHGIIFAVQQKLGHTVEGWVGSSVIHLGDHNVPNALLFIDKYLSVPRILNPIVRCIKYIQNDLVKDPALVALVGSKFESIEGAVRTILHDFLRSAFDGSGADNFFDAGSCIDGRLTSAWNWCQQLADKEYYFLFKLSGFLSFDGDF